MDVVHRIGQPAQAFLHRAWRGRLPGAEHAPFADRGGVGDGAGELEVRAGESGLEMVELPDVAGSRRSSVWMSSTTSSRGALLVVTTGQDSRPCRRSSEST